MEREGKGRTYRSSKRRAEETQKAYEAARELSRAQRERRNAADWSPIREARPPREAAPVRPVGIKPMRPSFSLERHPGLKRFLLFGAAPFAGLVIVLVLIHVIHLSAMPAYGVPSEEEVYERENFPLYYRDLIATYAGEYELPQSLVSAVILCESSFKPEAESRVDARGLMQLMPDTAQWIGEKLDEGEGYTFDLMYNPADNLRYGCWYLDYLSDRFDGDYTKIVCAYHAGQGNVDAWLQNPEYSPDGVTLATIPMEDTRAYAERVLNAQKIYQRRDFPESEPGEAPDV